MTRSALRGTLYRGATTMLALALMAAAATPAAAARLATPAPQPLGAAVAGVLAPAPVGGVAGSLGSVPAGVKKKDGPGPAPIATPAVPANLPADLEEPSSYVGQTSCEPVNKPGAVALGQLLKATYPQTSYGVARACTVRMASEHYDGRAVDWMISVRKPAEAAQANALISWLLAPDAAGRTFANARRLGIMYMIWNNKIWESYRASAGWQPYNNCAKTPSPSLDSSCHRNHIHFSLSWEGAMKRTSYWTKKVAAADFGPCRPADLNFAAPYYKARPVRCPRYAKIAAPAGSSAALANLYKFSGAYLRPGSSGPGVVAVQQALGISPANGSFGPKTTAAVVKVKQAYKLGSNPLMDQATWRVLLKWVAARQPKLASSKAPAPKPAGNVLTPYRNTVLKYNARGAAVSALQRALNVKPVSGWFGPVTRSAVLTFQRKRKLPATGAVDARTWAALGA